MNIGVVVSQRMDGCNYSRLVSNDLIDIMPNPKVENMHPLGCMSSKIRNNTKINQRLLILI